MPVKHPSPLLGYNNNVRHKGKVFHVQTEDSGVKYGHIITHLFMDGGRILKSVKTSYSEYVDNDRMGEIVREMMKQQHKAMFIALRDGKFDPIIDGAEAASQSTQAFPAAPPVVPPRAAVGRRCVRPRGRPRRRRRPPLAPARRVRRVRRRRPRDHGGGGAADAPAGLRRAGARHRRGRARGRRREHELALAARLGRPSAAARRTSSARRPAPASTA